jgi:glycosyltransferase involved in cell wall biosynthesis
MEFRQNKSTNLEPSRILFFTIAIDSHDSVLAQTQDWIKGLSEVFDEVYGFALHIGGHLNLPRNVVLTQIGGKGLIRRSLGIMDSFKVIIGMRKKKRTVVLYHMITWPIIVFGPFFKLGAYKQGLWYSHHYADLPLRITSKIVDKYFSPTRGTFPLKSKRNLVNTGHSLDFTEFSRNRAMQCARNNYSIYCIGRIAPVKQIELLIDVLASLKNKIPKQISVSLIGPIQDVGYLEFLKDRSKYTGIDLLLTGPMLREELIPFLQSVKFVFNGTPSSVDKSALEACASGAILITDNSELQYLTGMDLVWRNVPIGPNPSVGDQVNYLINQNEDALINISKHVISSTISKNDFMNTIRLIKRELA